MSNLTPLDIRVAGQYEAAREAARRHLADVRSHRRISIGDLVTLVFENRETVRGVVEEVVRAEHLSDSAAIAGEVEAFNAIIPAPGELSASLYLEVADPGDLAAVARSVEGVETTVFLEVGGRRVNGVCEEVRVESEESAMYHLRFALGDDLTRAWRDGAPVVAGCDHPACAGRVELRDDQREALAADLTAN
jgi:hypothetical protein